MTAISGISRPLPQTLASAGQMLASVKKQTPWLVQLERNQVYNRLFVETLGFYLWTIALARSRYEMMENFIDLAGWCVIGVLLPLGLDAVFRKRIGKQLAAHYAHLLNPQAKRNILEVPFEFLDKAGLKKVQPHWQTLVKDLGFDSAEDAVKTLNRSPELVSKIQQAKLLILFVDLFCMALKGQLSQWGGKWLTEKLSGKKGFSGEFAYASDDYLKKQAAADRTRKQRQLFSVVWGLSGAVSLPLIMAALLKAPASKGMVGKLKAMLPAFNYVDAIFMSKWLILWHNIFNWTAPSLLSARDVHEFREKLTKCASYDFFYFFGDDVLTGLGAKWFSKGRDVTQSPVGPLWDQHKLGPFTWPTGKRLSQVYDVVQDSKHWVYQVTRNSFLFGLSGTTLGLGVMTTVLNNWYTRKKVMKEQAQLLNDKLSKIPVNLQAISFDQWLAQTRPG